jgi:LCCL domain
MFKRACIVGFPILAAVSFSVALSGAAAPIGGLDWNANASNFVGKNGLVLTYKCPPKGTIGTIWGTGVYTSDSKVCTAAVHVGLITAASGGTVMIKIVPGRPSYPGSTRHGVTSSSYGSWSSSYSFVVTPKAPAATGPILDGGRTWTATAAAGAIGSRYRYSCPPNGKLGPVIGSTVYASSSSVCSAAVHAGQISATQGGNVVISVQAGRSSYPGTFKNGVASKASGPSKSSFTFTKP